MKNIFSTSAIFLAIGFSACGPASEDREMMHKKARVFQDSIANTIRAQIAEAETPAAAGAPVQIADSNAIKQAVIAPPAPAQQTK